MKPFNLFKEGLNALQQGQEPPEYAYIDIEKTGNQFRLDENLSELPENFTPTINEAGNKVDKVSSYFYRPTTKITKQEALELAEAFGKKKQFELWLKELEETK